MQNNAEDQVAAGFFVRLAAYLVDMIIVGAILLTVRFPLWILNLFNGDSIVFQDLIFQYSIKDMMLYLLKAAYFVLLTYFTGATLGKRLFHIQVVSAENRDFTFFEIVYRETVGKFLSAVIIYAGYLMVIVSSRKVGLHDILSDTRVIYCHMKKVKVKTPVTYRNKPDVPPYSMPQNDGMMSQGNIPPQPPQSGMMPQWNIPPQARSMPPQQGNVFPQDNQEL